MNSDRERSLELRPAVADDEAFLFGLYCSERAGDFSALGLGDAALETLLQTQFSAREKQYRAQYPDADFDIVLHNAKPIANLYAQRGPEAFVLIDITVVPAMRSRGIGTELVTALIEVASAAKKPLLAHVLLNNPAWHLWQRLGFRHVSDDGVYRAIEVPAAQTRQ